MFRSLAAAALLVAATLALPAEARPADPPRAAGVTVVAQAEGGSAVRAGRNLGNIVKSWGGALLLGVAGLMGLAALAKRNLAEGVTLMAIVVLVGGFIFADDAVKGFVEALWTAVADGA